MLSLVSITYGFRETALGFYVNTFYFANMIRETGIASETLHSPRVQRKRAERQQRIVETAMQLLAEGGLGHVTVQRLARELDYTPGALYRYFPSMEALLAHMQRVAIASLQVRLARAVAALPPDSEALDRLRAAAGAYLQSTVDAPHEMSLISQLLAVPRALIGDEQNRETLPRIVAVLHVIEQLIAEAQASGALTPGPARERTVQLWAALQGAVQLDKLSRFDATLFSATTVGAGLVESVLVGWGAQPHA